MINFLEKFWFSSNDKSEKLKNIESNIKKFSELYKIDKEILYKEYFLCEVLDMLNKNWADFLVLKWWAALSLFYWSRRFSDDLDLDVNFSFEVSSKKRHEDIESFLKKINWLVYENKDTWIRMSIKTHNTKNYVSWTVKILNKEFKNYESIWLDIVLNSFQNYEELELSKDKKDLFLFEWLKFKCLDISNFVSDKMISFWERFKLSDLYDLNFLLKYDSKIRLSDLIWKARVERYWKESEFLNNEEISEFKRNLLYRLDNIKNFNLSIMINKKIVDYREEEILWQLDTLNERLVYSDRINWKEDFVRFIEEFQEIVRNNFENHFVWDEDDINVWQLNTDNEFSDDFWEDSLDFLFEEEIELKKFSINEIRKSINHWNSRNENSKGIKLKDWKLLTIYWNLYVLIDVENKWFQNFENKEELINYLFQNQFDLIDNETFKKIF